MGCAVVGRAVVVRFVVVRIVVGRRVVGIVVDFVVGRFVVILVVVLVVVAVGGDFVVFGRPVMIGAGVVVVVEILTFAKTSLTFVNRENVPKVVHSNIIYHYPS